MPAPLTNNIYSPVRQTSNLQKWVHIFAPMNECQFMHPFEREAATILFQKSARQLPYDVYVMPAPLTNNIYSPVRQTSNLQKWVHIFAPMNECQFMHPFEREAATILFQKSARQLPFFLGRFSWGTLAFSIRFKQFQGPAGCLPLGQSSLALIDFQPGIFYSGLSYRHRRSADGEGILWLDFIRQYANTREQCEFSHLFAA